MPLRSLFSSSGGDRRGRSRSASQSRHRKGGQISSSSSSSSYRNTQPHSQQSYSQPQVQYPSSRSRNQPPSHRQQSSFDDDDTASVRRRNFSFMKYGDNERRDSVSKSKWQEHTRQLALAVSTDEYSVEPTPTSSAGGSVATTHLHGGDIVNGGGADEFDPFNTRAITKQAANRSMLDPPAARVSHGSSVSSMSSQSFFSSGQGRQHPSVTPTNRDEGSSVYSGWENGSSASSGVAGFSGSAFETDFFPRPSRSSDPFVVSPSGRIPRKKSHRLDKFVERQQRKSPSNFPNVKTSSASYTQSTTGSAPASTTGRPGAERSVISMPTMPSNSTMQATYVRQGAPSPSRSHSHQPAITPSSTSSSVGGTSNGGGAAARRRMRATMRSGASNFSSNSSVCSESSHGSSYTNASPRGAPPPESPGPRRGLSHAAASRRPSQTLQQFMSSSPAPPRSKMSSAISEVSVISNHSRGANIFDSNLAGGGFTFDAFGLDQNQVEREVDEAMEALADQIPDFSAYFGQSSASISISHSARSESPADEFALQGWDSPASSRQGTPTPPDEAEGFVDGFKIAKQTVQSTPLNEDEQNRFFAPPTVQRTQQLTDHSRPLPMSSPPPHPKAHRTPPRWEPASSQKTPSSMRRSKYSKSASQSSSSHGDFQNIYGQSSSSYNPDFQQGQHSAIPSATGFDDQINPWKEDPWRYNSDSSSPEDNDQHSDTGTESDFGVKSDSGGFRTSSDKPTSGSKSDVGASGLSRSVSFRSKPHLPPVVPSKISRHGVTPEDDSDDHDQLQREFSQEFIEESLSDAQQQQPMSSFGGKPLSNVKDLAAGFLQTQRNVASQNQPRTSFDAFRNRSQQVAQRQSSRDDQQSVPDAHAFEANFDDMVGYDRKPSDDATSEFGAVSDAAAASEFATAHSDFGSSVAGAYSDFADFSRGDHGSRVGESSTKSDAEMPAGNVTRKNLSPQDHKHGAQNTTQQPTSTEHEEKKDEEEHVPVNDLKSKWKQWESKTTSSDPSPSRQPSRRYTAGRSLPPTPNRPMPSPTQAMPISPQQSSSQSSPLKGLRAVKPDPAAVARQDRLAECNDQRNSFASFRERLRPAQPRESEVTQPSPNAQSVGSRVAQFSSPPKNTPQRSNLHEQPSDAPAFLSAVKLRKTTPPLHPTDNEHSFEQEEDRNQQPASQEDYDGRRVSRDDGMSVASSRQQHKQPETADKVPERKMTYRERRELELQREREAKTQQEAQQEVHSPPKRDVASLIKRRIAANKQKSTTPKNHGAAPAPAQSIASFRSNLRSVKTESRAHPPKSPQIQNSTGQSGANALSADHTRLSSVQQDRNSPSQIDSQHVTMRSADCRRPSSTNSHDTVDANTSASASPSTKQQPLHFSFHNEASPKSDPSQSLPETVEIQPPKTQAARIQKFVDAKKSETTDGSSVRSHETPATVATSHETSETADDAPEDPAAVKALLSNFLGSKLANRPTVPPPKKEDDAGALMRIKSIERKKTEDEDTNQSEPQDHSEPSPPPPPSNGQLALKDDPKYERYFRMLRAGVPMEAVKNALERDGFDSSIMDGDHDKPVGLPLREDPKYQKYFKMLRYGMPMEQVKHAMERDGLLPDVMDQDHDLPAITAESRSKKQRKEKPTHRRARLHWNTLQKVRSNSLWATIQKDTENSQLDIDEEEFNQLFKADLTPALSPKGLGASRKRGAAVRVIDPKRANNGGIILARLKMSHDDMADAVDRIDDDMLSPEQIENIIEFLPTKEERQSLEKYMLQGDQSAAEKFDSLCECEKFMVSMMTVKHARRKVRALLFKLQMMTCLESISEDTSAIERACDELKNSKRLRQLLGIVLQIGNRLNTAGAQDRKKAGAFTLDSLLKLNQAKAFDKKTTILQYVVLIVQRNNQDLLGFVDDLQTVLKADRIYWDQCVSDLEGVESQLENVRRISLYQAREKQHRMIEGTSRDDGEESLGGVVMELNEEVEALRSTSIGVFTLNAIKQVSALRDKVDATNKKFYSVLEYFGQEDKKMQPHEIFKIIGTFCREFQKEREAVVRNQKKREREERKNARTQNGANSRGNGNNNNNGSNNGNAGSQNGRPPTTPLRVSSMQPSMSKVFQDLQRQSGKPVQQLEPKNPARPSFPVIDQEALRRQIESRSNKQGRNQPERTVSAGPIAQIPENPIPRGMQETGRMEPPPPVIRQSAPAAPGDGDQGSHGLSSQNMHEQPASRQQPPAPARPPSTSRSSSDSIPSSRQNQAASLGRAAMMRQRARMSKQRMSQSSVRATAVPMSRSDNPAGATKVTRGVDPPSEQDAAALPSSSEMDLSPEATGPTESSQPRSSMERGRPSTPASSTTLKSGRISPRSMARHRRRLEARKRMSQGGR